MRQTLLWPSVILGPILGAAAPVASTLPNLRFKPDGTFQLSIFEDLHFGEGEDNPPQLGWGPISDQKSLGVMNTILDTEHPDLAILNGDLITGENTFVENSTDYLDMIVGPLVNRSIPWASTYGNHDWNYNLSTEAILKREQTYTKLAYTQKMVNSANAGVSNYYLPIYGSDTASSTPEVLLWFFDSKGGVEYQQRDASGNTVSAPGVVDQSVVDWFTSTNKALTSQYKKAIPSLAFVHIPPYAETAAQLTPGAIDSLTSPGINDDNPAAPQGVVNGKYTGADVPFMSALLNTTGLIAVFSGHDHGNDWCYKWNSKLNGMDLTGNGLDICFSRHTGYGGYGTWTRGSRQIRLFENLLPEKTVMTWNRLEDESISGLVSLNATYGQDKYPAVQDTHE